ncbi:hypothetical protein QQF64_004334 [Cirrhinus molitorella]|uniref:Uncharacterized protein n=1 Tax=Cirrhinus molitorella TaxID=172907 RepID=A0ABR3MJ32_9TELE
MTQQMGSWYASVIFSLGEQLSPALFTGESCSQAKPNSATQITQKLASHCSSNSITSSRPPIPTDRRAGLATAVQRQTAAVCLSCSQSARLCARSPLSQPVTVCRVAAAFPRLQTAERERKREGVSQIKQELPDSDEKLGKLGASQANALCRVAETAC